MKEVMLPLILDVLLRYVLPLFGGMMLGFGGTRLAMKALHPVPPYHAGEAPDSVTRENVAAARDVIRPRFNRGLWIIILLMSVAMLETAFFDVSNIYISIIFFVFTLLVGGWAAYWAHRYEAMIATTPGENL